MSVFSPPKSPEDFRWQKRIIVNYSSEGFDSEFLSNHRQEIRDRKLLLVHLVGKNLIWTNAEESLDVSGFMELKEKIRPTSTWALVGLDGGVKSQGGSELPMEELFRLIDSMPMRQSEMRKDNKQK
ncbi:DUF4174 domain-containing protein [Algoriphagus boseongensis]|nr:DUF4174 domain-containing protein [Algoriphagus boseongensis]